MNEAIDKIFEQKDTTDIDAIKEEVKKLMMSSMTKKPRGRAVKAENKKVEQEINPEPVQENNDKIEPEITKSSDVSETPCPSPASVEVNEISAGAVVIPAKKPRQRATKIKKDEPVIEPSSIGEMKITSDTDASTATETSESPTPQRKARQRTIAKKTAVIDVPSETVSSEAEEQQKPVRVPRARKVKAPIEPERRCSTVHRIGNITKQCAEEKVGDEPYCQKCLTKINKSQGKIPKGKAKVGGAAPTNLLSNYMDEKQIKELVEGEKNNVVIEAIGNGYYRGKTDNFCYRTMGPPSHLVCIGKLNEATKKVEPLSNEEIKFQIETRRITCTHDEKISEQYIEALTTREKNKIVAVKATVIEDLFSKFRLPDINTSVHTMKPGDDVSDEEDLSEEE